MIEKQNDLLTGLEFSLFTSLLKLRLSKRKENYEASDALIELLSDSVDPINGIGAIESSIKMVVIDKSLQSSIALSLSLKALTIMLKKLPIEVLEDEIPRVKEVLIHGLYNEFGHVRQSSVNAIVAAHSVLRDERKLFALTQIPKEKEGLLAYYMSRALN